ncbi:MAG: TfuA-related McrA-glycine thioamidation protein [Halobacteriota archaeon]|jgi:TfuA protein
MAKHDCIIFTGPSLSWSEVASIDGRLHCCAPAVRGDVSGAAKAGASLIGLIDGVFYDRAAVSHREIIDAVRSGVTVVGGSSMGALRASELDGFGMIGVGKIYACFKQGLIEADDEVAVAYNPVTFAPVSDPLVNIRFALHSLVKTGVVDTTTSDALLGLARSIFYMERSFPPLLSIAEQRALVTKQGRTAIETFLADHDYDLKKRDAKLVVQAAIKLDNQLR